MGVNALCALCAGGNGDSPLREEGAWCVRRGHSAHPGVWGWGQAGDCVILCREVGGGEFLGWLFVFA